MNKEPITKEKTDELLRFLPLFDVPGRDFFEKWEGVDKTPNGTMAMPHPVYPDDVLQFYWTAGQPCWSDYDYQPTEAARMLQDDEFISNATLADIKTVLTYCVRGERFADGHWGAMLESGKVVAILKRLQTLREQM